MTQKYILKLLKPYPDYCKISDMHKVSVYKYNENGEYSYYMNERPKYAFITDEEPDYVIYPAKNNDDSENEYLCNHDSIQRFPTWDYDHLEDVMYEGRIFEFINAYMKKGQEE